MSSVSTISEDQTASPSDDSSSVTPEPGPKTPLKTFQPLEDQENRMTTAQAVETLSHLGLSDEEILEYSRNGIDIPPAFEADGHPDHVLEAIHRISENMPFENSKFRMPNVNFTHLQPFTQSIEYEDLNPDVQRYASRLRPKIAMPTIPHFDDTKLSTATRMADGTEPSLKSRDASVVLIYLIGPPCSGKTTIAKNICEKYHFRYIGVGEILEKERHNPESPYQSVLDNMLSKGLLGPYKMVPSILISEISKEMEKGFKQVFLIDGFPRDRDRAIYFEKKMQPCDVLINFECPVTTCISRALRELDDPTDEIWEDVKDKVGKRYEAHDTESGLVLDYFRRQGRVANIAANIRLDQVQSQVEVILKNNLVSGFVGNRRETMEEVNRKAWELMRETMGRQWENDGYLHSESDTEDQDTEMMNGRDTYEQQSQKKDKTPATANGNGTAKASEAQISSIFEGAKLPFNPPGYIMTPADTTEREEDMLTKNAGKTPVAHRVSRFKNALGRRLSITSMPSDSSHEDDHDDEGMQTNMSGSPTKTLKGKKHMLSRDERCEQQ